MKKTIFIFLFVLCLLFSLSACLENKQASCLHEKTELPSVEPTCTEVGFTKGSICSKCDKILVEPSEIDALGHIWNAEGKCNMCENSVVFTKGLKFKLIKNGTEYAVCGMGTATNVKELFIPNEHNGKPVTQIYDFSFQYCKLKSIYIPSSITYIGKDVMYDCEIEQATIPAIACSNVKSHKLQEVVITSGEYIAENAFADCTALTSVTLPDSVTSIGDSAFRVCKNLTSIELPESLTSIGEYAFSSCKVLTNITIPDGVTNIGDYAFNGCDSLMYNRKGGVKYLGNSTNPYIVAVNADKNITSAELPDTVKAIYCEAFKDCENLKRISIPDSVTSIGEYSFYRCKKLTSITIPDGVTEIRGNTFYICDALISITIPDSVTSIGNRAFSGCNKLVEVCNNSSLDIVAGSTSNGYVAKYALNVYSSSSGESKLNTTDDGYVFYADDENVCLVGYVGNAKDLVLPENYNGENYEIYDWAFYSCKSLTSITIGNGVTSIGDYAFYYCSRLTSITIPDSVTSVGLSAFKACTGLTEIHFTGTAEQWEAITKENNWNLNTGAYTIYCTDGEIAK